MITDLSYKNLKEIPNDIPIETTILFLNNNQITKIENLDKLVNLRVYINGNRIKYLSKIYIN